MNDEKRPDDLPKVSLIETVDWEFYKKTPFGNNLYIGYNKDRKEYQICSDASPWFCVPGDTLERVQQSAAFMLDAYGKYMQERLEKEETTGK